MTFSRFVINEYFINFPNPQKKDAVCMWNHACAAIGATDEEYKNMKKIFKQATHYGICKNNTYLDRWFSDYLAKMGKKSVVGAEYCAMGDIFVQGDFICQVFYEPQFRNGVDELYKKTKSASDFDINKYFETVLNKKTKINLLITKNTTMADNLREEAITLYRLNKK